MSKEMKMLTSGLITQKHTKVMKETEYEYNAPHLYTINKVENNEEICRIDFQKGPIKDCGINGTSIEDLVAICIDRLQHFQNSKFYCKENQMALNRLEETLMWLRKRTSDREAKGIEGTNIVDSIEDNLSKNIIYRSLNTYQKEQLDIFMNENSIKRDDIHLELHPSSVEIVLAVNKKDLQNSCILYRVEGQE